MKKEHWMWIAIGTLFVLQGINLTLTAGQICKAKHYKKSCSYHQKGNYGAPILKSGKACCASKKNATTKTQ